MCFVGISTAFIDISALCLAVFSDKVTSLSVREGGRLVDRWAAAAADKMNRTVAGSISILLAGFARVRFPGCIHTFLFVESNYLR